MMTRKNAQCDLQKDLLHEVVSSYFLANDKRIPEIRNSEDCYNTSLATSGYIDEIRIVL